MPLNSSIHIITSTLLSLQSCLYTCLYYSSKNAPLYICILQTLLTLTTLHTLYVPTKKRMDLTFCACLQYSLYRCQFTTSPKVMTMPVFCMFKITLHIWSHPLRVNPEYVPYLKVKGYTSLDLQTKYTQLNTTCFISIISTVISKPQSL